jgi:hypothetical protein
MLQGRVCDISAEGMLVESPDPLWVGASFSARLVLDQRLRVDCVLRRVEPGRGMGVTFVVPGEECRARVTALLETLTQK